LVNLTDTVHDCPGATANPVQVLGPASAPLLKLYWAAVPLGWLTTTFVTDTLEHVAAGVQVLVSVTKPVVVTLPEMLTSGLSNVMVNGFGVIDTAAREATPLPARFTTMGVILWAAGAAAFAIVSVRGNDPVVVGANNTFTVQEAPAAKFAPQLPPAVPAGREYGCGAAPPKAYVKLDSGELPVLVTVSVIGALVVPVAQLPNASGFGPTLAV
jgi:hypothetical protein